MRIKRYFDKNIRDAIRKVREEQGPDAVIISNRKIDGGVEIVAAIDFDEVVLEAGAPLRHDSRDGGGRATPGAVAGDSRDGGGRATPGAVAGDSRDGGGRATPGAVAGTAIGEPPRVATPAPSAAPVAGPVDTIRFPDPALLDMRRELKNLRGLIEQQISSLVWGDMARRQPLRAKLLRLLLQLELSPGLCQQLVSELTDDSRDGGGRATPGAIADTNDNDAHKAWRDVLAVLAHKLPVTDYDILADGGVIALLGPTGVGKTTTAAKLAARFAVRHGARHVALVTTDNYRIGAHEQLRAYARILDVPLRVAADRNELREILKELADRKLVLIDTAGMSQRDMRLSEQFALIRAGSADIKNYLVLSATTRDAGIDEIIRYYQHVNPRGCILTKVDEAGSLGGVLSQLIRYKLPAAYVSDGQKVPEDLHTASTHRLIGRSVAMMHRGEQVPEDPSLAMILGGVTAHAC